MITYESSSLISREIPKETYLVSFSFYFVIIQQNSYLFGSVGS